LQPSVIAKPVKIGFTQFTAEKIRALKAGDEVLIFALVFTGSHKLSYD
jgi:hypothetical protein